MSVPEILAPAGSFEALTAAVRCGADAVYIGGKDYSARQSAANFNIDEIREAARQCHLYGSKLYLAVNTVITDSELKGFCSYIKEAAQAGIDACIVQDMGAAEIIRRTVPEMPFHASTQMTIHTAEGVLWAKEHGFCRVVAARELSRQEIKPLLSCDTEIEQFVHGALCMSVSGQCYMSALIGSRSANRGRCAQACRLPFSAVQNKNAACLSLKDLSLVEHMDSLVEDGVHSLKIEGRMKRPEYTAAAVTALKTAREGGKPSMDTLKAVFSRSGFTDSYYTGTRENIFGTREKEDVTAAKDVLPELKQLYHKQNHPVALDMEVSLKAGEALKVTGTDSEGNTVTVYGSIPEAALKKAADREYLERQLSKLGDTVFYLRNFSCVCDGVSILPASSLNAVRRELTEKLQEKRIESNTPVYSIKDCTCEKMTLGHRRTVPNLRFRVRTSAQLNALKLTQNEEAVLSMELAEKTEPALNFIVGAPRFVPCEEKLRERLALLRKKGYTRLMCENPAHIRIGKALGYELSAGIDLHTMNSISAEVYAKEGIKDIMLSPELTLKQAAGINSAVPVGMYAYGRLPAMLMRCCPIKNQVGCKNCTGSLTDRTNRKFPVICGRDYTELLNSMPVWMADRMEELCVCDFILIDFTSETPREAELTANAYRYGSTEKPDAFTRGLMYRGIESQENKGK